MTIKGKGNFKGTITRNFTIESKPLDDRDCPVLLLVPDVAYMNKAGKYISKPILIDKDGTTLKAGKDYDRVVTYQLEDGTILNKSSIVPLGKYVKVTVYGKGAYSGKLESFYRITEKDFSKAKVTIQAQAYTGQEVTLGKEDFRQVKVGGSDITMNYGTDYEIVKGSYRNNTKKGTASVIVRGLGSYGGSKTVRFSIKSKGF